MSGIDSAQPRRTTFSDQVLSATGVVLLLGIWTVAAHSGRFSQLIVIPPLDVLATLRELLSSGELTLHLGQSFHRLANGFMAGGIAGIVWGALMAVSVNFSAATAPVFNAVRQVPSVAFIPLLILVFGIGETFKIVIVAKAAFFPIALSSCNAIRAISRNHLEIAKIYRLSPLARLRYVIWPGALSNLLTGVRLGLGKSWAVLVAAELFAADFGIGQLMESGRQLFRLDVVFVGVLITGVIGYLLDRGLQFIERRLTAWNTSEAV